jgi:glyoxylase-like metal-dependent hydrolase (beta-lactamase superfamily II)
MAFTFHRIPLGICNCYLLRGERSVFIDGGAPGGIRSFVTHMQRLNIDPRSIELILLTHGHWDHIACLSALRAMTGAKVAIHHRDQPFVESGMPPFPRGVNAYGRAMSALAKALIHPKLPPVKVERVIGDEGMTLEEYGIPARVIYTPGHSMGHVSILLEDGNAFVGDMAMNDWYLRLTPGLPILAEDIGMVVESWKKILPGGIKRIYPAHGADFPVEIIHKEIEAFDHLPPNG